MHSTPHLAARVPPNTARGMGKGKVAIAVAIAVATSKLRWQLRPQLGVLTDFARSCHRLAPAGYGTHVPFGIGPVPGAQLPGAFITRSRYRLFLGLHVKALQFSAFFRLFWICTVTGPLPTWTGRKRPLKGPLPQPVKKERQRTFSRNRSVSRSKVQVGMP